MAPKPGLPGWFGVTLRVCCLALGVAAVVYSFLPAEWFVVADPAGGGPLMINRSHRDRVPLEWLWALEGLRHAPPAATAVAFGVLCVSAFWPTRGRRPRPPSRPDDRRAAWPGAPVWVAAGGAAAVGVFCLLRVSYEKNAGFADAPILPNEVEVGMVFAGEVLTYNVFAALRHLLEPLLERAAGREAVVLTACLAGGVFVAALAGLACVAARTTARRLSFLGGAVLAGYAVTFCGYVETTAIELAAMAAYFAAAAKTLHTPPGPLRTRWLILTLVALTFALMAHGGGVLLLPSLAVLLWHEAGGSATGRGMVLRRMLGWRNAALCGVFVALPYALVVVLPFYAWGEVGNVAGGGDGIMFVPWRMDPARPPSRYVYYSFLSWAHVGELGSALLLAAPLALPVCLGTAVLVLRRRVTLSAVDRGWLGVVAAAAGGCGLVPLLWNHDFGMWGDWNVAACYLFPLNLLAWAALAAVTPAGPDHDAARRVPTAAMILTQLIVSAGLLLQLW